MASAQGSSFWDAVRAWADDAGLLLPSDEQEPTKPTVPQAVCDSCPICQAAATLEQVNPQVLVDLTEVARSLIGGLGSALASASDQRFHGGSTEEADAFGELLEPDVDPDRDADREADAEADPEADPEAGPA
jgi:hypothetical protein